MSAVNEVAEAKGNVLSEQQGNPTPARQEAAETSGPSTPLTYMEKRHARILSRVPLDVSPTPDHYL